jgi:hypothetical protein
MQRKARNQFVARRAALAERLPGVASGLEKVHEYAVLEASPEFVVRGSFSAYGSLGSLRTRLIRSPELPNGWASWNTGPRGAVDC